jgi:hypothetical protein
MAEVTALHGTIRPVTQQGANELVKDLYDDLADDVASGDIQGIAVITVHRDETTSYDLAGIIACRGAVGALEEMKLDMVMSHTGREK